MTAITNPVPGSAFSQGVLAGDTQTLAVGTSATNGDSIAYNARWQWNLSGAESTANAGSDLLLQAIADDGFTVIGTVATYTRSTASVSFTGNVAATGYVLETIGNALTAVGTNRATALQLAKQINNVTTVGSGTGVILPVGVIGMTITVFNGDGTNAAQVYASGSETIDTVAGATGVVLTHAKRCQYFFVAANTWISAQLGVVSA